MWLRNERSLAEFTTIGQLVTVGLPKSARWHRRSPDMIIRLNVRPRKPVSYSPLATSSLTPTERRPSPDS